MYMYIYILYIHIYIHIPYFLFKINFPGNADRIQFQVTVICVKSYSKTQSKCYFI